MGIGPSMGDASFARREVLIRQINAIVEGTTGSATFKDVLRKGIERGWIGKVFVRGLTSQGRILQQIEIEIDWKEHLLKINDPSQSKIEVRSNLPERGRIPQIIDDFNERTQLEGLKTEWAVNYTPEANKHRPEVNQVLGLIDAELRNGSEEPSSFAIPPNSKLEELRISWEIVAESPDSGPPTDSISTDDSER